MKKYKYHIITLVAVLIFMVSFSVFGTDIDKENIKFLNSYGWEVEDILYDKSEIIIPDPFDMVYENYNLLQVEAGLDLRPYAGMKGMRYTYVVKNYPTKCEDTVLANVIVIEGKCVGGDIMTVPLDGFMHSLVFNSPMKKAQ